MFDVGFWELALIFGVGLLILGPERMPRVASQLGRWIGRARRTASSLRHQLEKEIATADSPPPPPRRKPKPLKPVNQPPPAAPESGSAPEEQQAPAEASADEPESAPAEENDAEQDTDEPAGGS
ncbi:MAG: Sec-independent protein translocase protein TatB [Gammaproteobacteria bacterium]